MPDTVATTKRAELFSAAQADQSQPPATLAWHPPKPKGGSAKTTSHTPAAQLDIPYTTKEGVTFVGRTRRGHTAITATAATRLTSRKELGERRKELDRSAEGSTLVEDDDVSNDDAEESAEDGEADEFEEQDSDYQPSVACSTSFERPRRAPVRMQVERSDDDLCDDDSSESEFSIEEMDSSIFKSIDRREQSLIRVAVMFLMGKSKKTGLSLSKIRKFIHNKSSSHGKQLGRRRILEAAQKVLDREWDNKYSSSFTSITVARSKISALIPASSAAAEQLPPQSLPSTPIATDRPSKYGSLLNFKYSEQQLVTYYVHWLKGASKREASRSSGVNMRSATRAFWEKGPQTQTIRERRKRVISIAKKQVANAKQRGEKVCFI